MSYARDVLREEGCHAVQPILDPDGAARALALLAEIETETGASAVDEAESLRLQAQADGAAADSSGWHPLLVERDDLAIGYGGLVLDRPGAVGRAPGEPDRRAAVTATGDVALARHRALCGGGLELLLAAFADLAQRHGAQTLRVWLRAATQEELGIATGAGLHIERRLGVLGRDLDGLAAVTRERQPEGVAVRPYRAGRDDEAVVEVLAAAYATTPEAGWDLTRLRERQRLDWYRDEDLLVAEDAGGRLLGVHWLKRRSERIGEVYNLAVHPDGQGQGIGEALLAAGLAHLAARGLRRVILWVDLDNPAAVDLYTAHGFVLHAQDVALVGELAPGRRSQASSGPRSSR